MRTRSIFKRLIPVIGLLLIAAVIGCAQETAQLDEYGRWVNGVSEPWSFPDSFSKEEIRAAQTQWTSIGSDNGISTKKAWEGNYLLGGETHGSYLRWSQQNGFVLIHVDKCAAQVMGFSYGRVVFKPNMIELIPDKTTSRKGDAHQAHDAHQAGQPLRFLPVMWRGNRHLVPEKEIAHFGDYVAGLGDYNNWIGTAIESVDFFAQIDQESGRTADRAATSSNSQSLLDQPQVPAGFEQFMKKPIRITVIAVGKDWRRPDTENPWWDHLIVPLTINAGQSRGIIPGMKFRIADSDEVIEATSVGSHRSQAMIVRNARKNPCVKFSDDDDCTGMDYKPIPVGIKASTSPFD
jgi:hypothetical protein